MNQRYKPSRPCPICGNRSGHALGKLTYALFDDLDMSGTKTLISCNRCGMLYDDVGFTNHQLHEYYRRNEHYAVSSFGGIHKIQPQKEKLIIDYGCGQGGFIQCCRQHGLTAVGIEPSQKSREVARESGLEVYESLDAFLAAGKKQPVEVIVLSHVLEHLLNPSDLLKKLAGITPGAMLYMEVPDAASYLSSVAIRWHELYFEHLNHFCRASLLILAEKTGIDVILSDTTPFSRNLSATQCQFLIGRLRNNGIQSAKDYGIDAIPTFELPPLPNGNLPDDNEPWGISQYAMLLMGSLPQLQRVNRLFDASPAKIGRKIRGITIEKSSDIFTLSELSRLIIPFSQYSSQMLKEVEQAGVLLDKIYLI